MVLYFGNPVISMRREWRRKRNYFEFEMRGISEMAAEDLLHDEHPADRASAILAAPIKLGQMERRILESWRSAPRQKRAQLMEKGFEQWI